MLKDAIKQARKQTQQALGKRFTRRLTKPMTPKRFEHVFNSYSVLFGHGNSPLLSKKSWGMLRNFIHSLKEEGWEDETVYGLAALLVESWPMKLAGVEVCTNRSICLTKLPIRPSLKAFLSCTNNILPILYEGEGV